ncbi:hypothetical protein CRE_17829 [Caenorhabditis remanei]|uniref:Uncharacterized protein n=1 Tax=Caenorhabditis remanei TaxID=31234 RepID=E3MDK0_CAERE|nr:hypothetical protein CRE_17829 [Caenorhabditis remanei]
MIKTATDLRREEKHLNLLQQKEKHAKKMLELQQKKGEMMKELREKEIQLLNQEMVFCQMKLNSVNEILLAMAEKERFDEFRSSCQKLIRQFEKFHKLFNDDVKTVFGNSEIKLKKPEKLMDAPEALQKFSDCLQSLTIINDNEVSSELMTDLEVMVEKSEDLRSTITDIIMEIEISLEKGELTKLDGIKEHYETAKVNVEELNALVPMFDIPATKRLDRVICHQLEILSSAMPQITTENAQKALKNKQITEVLGTEVEDRNSQLNDKQLQEQTEIVREEEQMNMLSDLMGTITNFSGLLERDQSDESVQNLVESIRDMFSDLSGLLGEGEEDDDEMKQIRYLLTAVMELTKGTE